MIRERTDANVLRIKSISTRVSGEAPFRRLCEVSGIKISLSHNLLPCAPLSL